MGGMENDRYFRRVFAKCFFEVVIGKACFCWSRKELSLFKEQKVLGDVCVRQKVPQAGGRRQHGDPGGLSRPHSGVGFYSRYKAKHTGGF